MVNHPHKLPLDASAAYRQQGKPNQGRKIPLRLVLIVPFLLEIFATVGLTGYLSFKNGQRAVDDLATQLRNEVSSRIDQHLQDYFDTSLLITQINGEAIQLGALDLNDPNALAAQFWRQQRIFTDVKYIYFSNAEGGFIGTGRESHGLTIEATRNNLPGDFEIYATSDRGDRLELLDVTPDYDARRRDWYTQARDAKKPGWSEVYSLFPQADLAISATYPIYAGDDFQGVIGVDLVLAGIDQFLREIRVLENGQTFILEPDGTLIATSTEDKPFIEIEGADEPERLKGIDSPNPLVQKATHYLQTQFKDLQGIDQPQQFQFEVDGARYYAQVTPITEPEHPDWLIVVMVPESDFMAQIHANTRNTILLCLGALGVATLLGIATTRWITRPISRLNQASQEIAQRPQNNGAHADALDPSISSSSIEELASLGTAFSQMAEQLQASFLALEENNASLENRVEQRTEELSEALTTLKTAQLQLIQQEKLSGLGQMVAGIAHEINNPISFIYGNLTYVHKYAQDLLNLIEAYHREYPQKNLRIDQISEDIELDFLTIDLPKILNSMTVGAERICEIILSLRNFSRIDQAEIKAVDIHEGLESTLMILQHRLKAHGDRPAITIEKHYGALPEISCYPGQLNQVFMNILSNAIDALEEAIPEQPKIQIQTQILGDDSIKISISDNGTGIPVEIQDRIFDPFFTTKDSNKGTGLGLLISYQIVVEKHGGTLSHQPSTWGGAEFTIQIPQALK